MLLILVANEHCLNYYLDLINSLVEEYGNQYKKYLYDFQDILKETGYYKDIYVNGKTTHSSFPAFCILTGDKTKTVLGVDFFTNDKTNDKKTYIVTYKGFKISKFYDDIVVGGEKATYSTTCTPSDVDEISKNYGCSGKTLSSRIVYRISTNILNDIEKEIEEQTKRNEEQKNKVYEQQSEEEAKLIGFPLTIENVYHLIFAHIETFMTIYYRHLNNISNDDDRTKLINEVINDLADVPKLTEKQDKIQPIPPFPTFLKKTDDEGDKITWPCTLLQERDFEETKFVKEIIDAALQLGNKIEEAKRNIEQSTKSNNPSMPVGTDKRIPSTILDAFSAEDYNPYASIYEDYKKNPQNNIKQKIWFTFMVRCAYFGMMFKKYRMYRIGGDASSYKYRPYVEDFKNVLEEGKTYFAISEACNIKKVFGDNISREIILDMVKDVATDEFKVFLKGYIDGSEETNFIENNEKLNWNLDFKSFKVNDDYIALPVKNIDNSKCFENIKNKNCLTSSDYVIFKTDGTPIDTKFDNKVVLNDSEDINIISPTVTYFSELKHKVKGDELIQKCSWDKLDKFLDYFYDNYLGSKINPGCVYSTNGEKPDKNVMLYRNLYSVNGEEKIFVYDNELKSYNELKKERTSLSTSEISLQAGNGDLVAKYTSIINGMRCVDPVNIISCGCTETTTKEHFPFANSSVTLRFLNDDATVYDKAYLFLFSLPVSTKYNEYVTSLNAKSVPKVCLLREGAFYYWQENFKTIKSHFNGNYGLEMERDNIPIVSTEKNKNCAAPTLHLLNNTGQTYLEWQSSSNVPLNRREKLINYFKDWAESSDFKNIMSIKPNLRGLSDSEMKTVMDLYMTDVLYVDFSTVIDRDVNTLNFGQNLPKCYEECTKFFTDSYDKFREYINLLYPEDTMLSSPPVLDLTDKEIGIKSNEDFKLSIYLTLQTLYNKFIAGNKLERWKFGEDESDFNNFLYMDSYFNLIGQRLVFNGTRIKDMLSKVSDTVVALANSDENLYKGSVYEFFSKLCQENGCNLIALPIRPYTIKKESNSQKLVWDLFDAIPYHKLKGDDSSCFVSMYTYEPSKYLDNQNDNGLYGYKQDGFNIDPNNEKDLPRQFKSEQVEISAFDRQRLKAAEQAINGDINANGSGDMPISLQNAKARIPSFAVTYAKQNQSIFKKITVGTANPQITEPAIAMTLNIASKSDSTPRDSVIFGQDLYSVYSNYSYTCDVEMMGCAPIMPLMYFQLNNIPMFKGAYQIIHVEHNIVAGNMTTRFKGVRVNKNAIPFVRASYVYNDKLGNRLYENDLYTEGEPITGNTTNTTTPSYGKETNIKGAVDSEKITEKNPLVCLTPAHGPKTQKRLENAWSTKVVERIIDKIENYNKNKNENSLIRYTYCNKDGVNTYEGGYSMRQTSNLIQKYGSKKVISLVPHWNGAGGKYYVAMTGGGKNNKPQRTDSLNLCKFVIDEAKKVKNSIKFNGMFDGDVKTLPLGSNNSDGAAQLDCACVLTENWFADYNSKDSTKWAQEPPGENTGRYWLESNEGIEAIANIHFNAIVNYIKSLNTT